MLRRLLFLFLLPICFSCTSKEALKSEKPTILVTIAPYAFFAERIGGDTIEVQTLVPQGMNIHIFEPTPKSVEKSGRALVWFQIGEPFENKIQRAFSEKNSQMTFVNLQEGLPLLSPHTAVNLDAMCSHDHGDKDLHTWTSPKLALSQAKTMAEKLITLFPEHKELYQKNFNDLAKEMQTLEKELTQLLLPYKGDAILVSHPGLSYFCRDFGLIQLSVECEGKDPRPKDIERILKQADQYTVRCVFLQQGFNDRGAILLGKKLKLPIHKIDPYAKDYLKNMRQIGQYVAK